MQHTTFDYTAQNIDMADSLGRLASRAERLGFDSLWPMDHFHQIRDFGKGTLQYQNHMDE